MKRLFLAIGLTAVSVPSFALDAGVSIAVAEPGFYGRIDIGDFPRPPAVNQQPVVIQPAVVVQQPIYMYVPPGHAKNWGRYCGEYNACNQRVYFVQESWYNDVYVPKKRGNGGGKHGKGHGKGKD